MTAPAPDLAAQTNEQWFAIAQHLIPGGVNSPVRAFGAVGGTPRFVARAAGATLWDVEGREYLDYCGSWGPAILGHAHPDVVKAIQAAVTHGASFGCATAAEVSLAKRIADAVPSIEKVRLVNSGTEATMTALRLARAHTQRPKFIKFAGCYHGHADPFLVQAGSGVATFAAPTAQPSSPGVSPATAADTLVAEFNDLGSVERLLLAHPRQVAAIILEPVVGNAGLIPPEPDFLLGLRHLASETAALLIFDEVMTGFRLAPGGAQQLYGVTPDLTTLGKVIGGGLPVGAFGGPAGIMDQLAPLGPVYQAGTLSGNPLAVAAGLATLERLTPDAYRTLESRASQLEQGIRNNLNSLGLPWQYQRVGSMACLYFTDTPVHNFADARRCDTKLFARYFHAMLAEGIYLPPAQFEAFFLSTTHTEADVERTIRANYHALASLRN